jgi:ribonuclease HII
MIGIDEVGRGAWAGPLLVVAFRQRAVLPEGIADSKVLSKTKRQHLAKLLEKSGDLGEGWVDPAEIDELGLTLAMRLAVERALIDIKALSIEEIIIDGNVNYCPIEFVSARAVVKADGSIPVVGAASILAKVRRDLVMKQLSDVHPNYGFDKHVGYGTKLHIEALRLHGFSSVHRLSYAPVAKFKKAK